MCTSGSCEGWVAGEPEATLVGGEGNDGGGIDGGMEVRGGDRSLLPKVDEAKGPRLWGN